MSLFSSLGVPRHRLLIILQNSSAILVSFAKIPLRVGNSFSSSFGIPMISLFIILWGVVTLTINMAKPKLSEPSKAVGIGTFVCRLAKSVNMFARR
jgi:hypothetical protein